jgi:hypothetical protein
MKYKVIKLSYDEEQLKRLEEKWKSFFEFYKVHSDSDYIVIYDANTKEERKISLEQHKFEWRPDLVISNLKNYIKNLLTRELRNSS